MPASTEPRSGLHYGWTLGESGWNAQMDANLLRLGRFGFHLSVKDRDLTAPPGGETARRVGKAQRAHQTHPTNGVTHAR